MFTPSFYNMSIFRPLMYLLNLIVLGTLCQINPRIEDQAEECNFFEQFSQSFQAFLRFFYPCINSLQIDHFFCDFFAQNLSSSFN